MQYIKIYIDYIFLNYRISNLEIEEKYRKNNLNIINLINIFLEKKKNLMIFNMYIQIIY